MLEPVRPRPTQSERTAAVLACREGPSCTGTRGKRESSISRNAQLCPGLEYNGRKDSLAFAKLKFPFNSTRGQEGRGKESHPVPGIAVQTRLVVGVSWWSIKHSLYQWLYQYDGTNQTPVRYGTAILCC